MSNSIYDILGKLNGLQPKDNPVSMSAEPVYESIDPQDITPAVDSLEEKYQNFLIEETAKRSQQKDAKISRGEPEIVKLLNKARLERPAAASDTEALAYQMVKANKELEKEKAANDEQEMKIGDLQAKVSAVPTVIKPTSSAIPPVAQTSVPTQAEPTVDRLPTLAREPAIAQAPAQVQAEPTVDRLPTLAREPANDTVPADKSANVVNFPKSTARTGTTSEPEEQPKVDTIDPVQAVVPPGPEDELPANVIKGKFGKDPLAVLDQPEEQEPEQSYGTYGLKESVNKGKNMLKENIQMLTEYAEGTPQLAMSNWNTLIQAWKNRQPKVDLQFGERHLTIWKEQMYAILSEFAADQNADRRMQRVEDVLASYDTTVQFMMLPRVKKFINQYPQFEKNDPVLKAAKAKQKVIAKTGQTDMFSGNSKLPVGSRNEEMQENLGNDNMQENVKTNSILEGVRQVEIKKLKEAAKPDFLDLDKDGDTDEPMKSAAKDAKKHEPADVDSDAVAKRKRLQALKDKQEDERAEKGDYDDEKSSKRVVKGRAYGGAAQKDDEDKDDLDESGLQYYTGKKKYGKEGMTALSKAGRDGASEEELGRIKDKYKKEDIEINEKAVSKQQQKFMGMVHAVQKGKMKAPSKLIAKTAKGMSDKAAHDFAATKHKGLPTKVTEGKDAIRNHPIYTTKEAWDHYAQELAEQEAMETSMMEAPMVDVQQELDEIAKLAGLPPKMESKCSSCGCADCKCSMLDEAATRKDFRKVAELIRDIEDKVKRLELATHHADIFKQQNPRFSHEKFYKAAGVDECDYNMGTQPAAIIVGEDKCPTCDCAPCKCDEGMMEAEMDEGNEFTKARLDAIQSGKDSFTVGGKTHAVTGDTSDEKTQVESVNEDINVNITANGEQDALNLLRKLSGMAEVPQVTGIAIPMGEEQATCETCGATPCGCEESVEEERDIELANTPHETVAPINAVTVDAGGGLGGVKKQYPLAANRGANPLEEEKLWTAYESMINDVKA